jgi:alpha-glucosidase (family GH31 glycosyl hydrolase)
MYSQRADSIFRIYAKWRLNLFPYIYSYALRSRLESKHMLGKFPDHVYQYSFGDEMLIAPVYEKGATTQEVFLPGGKWINYWTNEQLSGNARYVVQAPIHQLPIFVKQGAIIPMRRYASSVEKGNNDTIMLHIYPGADGRFTLLEDDGTSNDYLKGGYASTLIEMAGASQKFQLKINPVAGNYAGMTKNRNWELHIHLNNPNLKILLDHQALQYRYDEERKVGIADIPRRAKKSITTIEIIE